MARLSEVIFGLYLPMSNVHSYISLAGHNCVWYNQLPSWVSSGGFDNATLTSIVANHCGTLVGHYKGQM